MRLTLACTPLPSTRIHHAPSTPGRMVTGKLLPRTPYSVVASVCCQVSPFSSVFAPRREAAELADQAALDHLAIAEIEEAAMLLHHFLPAFLARLGRFLHHGAVEPRVEPRQFRRRKLVEAGGLEFLGTHLALDRRAVALLRR